MACHIFVCKLAKARNGGSAAFSACFASRGSFPALSCRRASRAFRGPLQGSPALWQHSPSHFPPLAAKAIEERPALAAILGNREIEIATIRMAARSRQRLHFPRVQEPCSSCHVSISALPTALPYVADWDERQRTITKMSGKRVPNCSDLMTLANCSGRSQIIVWRSPSPPFFETSHDMRR